VVPALWSGVMLALGAPDEAVRRDAAALATMLVPRARPAPPRGFRTLADAARQAGFHDLALLSFRAAVAAGETGAALALSDALVSRGWSHARAGERDLAIAALTEAKSLAALK
jgi:hypothetical protein